MDVTTPNRLENRPDEETRSPPTVDESPRTRVDREAGGVGVAGSSDRSGGGNTSGATVGQEAQERSAAATSTGPPTRETAEDVEGIPNETLFVGNLSYK